MPAPLILVSHTPPIADYHGQPRTDYDELATALRGNLLFPPEGCNPFRMIEQRAAFDLRQAMSALRRANVSVYISLSEKIGLPLALLNHKRKTPHLMVAHHLNTLPKRMLHRLTGVLTRLDRIVVLCRAQEVFLQEIGIAPGRICCVSDSVDDGFWHRAPALELENGGSVLAVGREQRDYQTLLAAVASLKRRTIIVGSSLYKSSRLSLSLPPSVELRVNLSFHELRCLYAAASVVVVPLRKDTDFAAGSNALLEAMAMRCPLIVTRTLGLAEYVDPNTACLVPPDDPEALRRAIETVINNPNQFATQINNGQETVVKTHRLDTYVQEIAAITRQVVGA